MELLMLKSNLNVNVRNLKVRTEELIKKIEAMENGDCSQFFRQKKRMKETIYDFGKKAINAVNI